MEKSNLKGQKAEIDREELEKEARRLINLIKTKFLTKEGLLARNYPAQKRTLFDNFDDLVPFFLYFGEEDFLLGQVRLIKKLGYDFPSLCVDRGVIITRNVDEWFGGLYALWQKTRDADTYNLLEESLAFLEKNILRDDYLAAAYYPRSGKRVNFWEPWSAGLLETFCEMREEFPRFFKRGQKILKAWTEQEYFKKYRLFPYRVYACPFVNFFQKKIFSKKPPYPLNSAAPFWANDGGIKGTLKNQARGWDLKRRNGWYSQLMKSNSTPAFALLEYYRVTGDPFWPAQLERWIKSALWHFVSGGRVFGEFVPRKNARRYAGAAPAFILVDVICDAGYFCPRLKKYLARAKEIIDYQWENRLGNGLIEEIKESGRAHLDNQIDWGVSLRKYAEISGEKEYLEKGIKLTQKALRKHASAQGFLTYSGRVKEKIIDPKYNALALKGYVNLLTANRPLYPKDYNLFKDR